MTTDPARPDEPTRGTLGDWSHDVTFRDADTGDVVGTYPCHHGCSEAPPIARQRELDALRTLLAQAIHEDVMTDPAVLVCVHDATGDWCARYAIDILATASGARLLAHCSSSDQAGHAAMAARVEALEGALATIAEQGCAASRWHDEDPPVPDRCLDPDFYEDEPDRPCDPCFARAALAQQPASTDGGVG